MIGEILITVWVLMSITAFAVYAYDKKIAGTGRWRVPERTLILLALLMGAPGAWAAMKFFRHKTRHKQFTIPVPIFAVLQTALMIYLMIKGY